jgi:RNA polymerase sigma factor (sigma-70 family)
MSFMALSTTFLGFHVKFRPFAKTYIMRGIYGSGRMRTEDGSIIQECFDGKPEAFGLLVDKYKGGIFAFVYGRLGRLQDAQDVTQEVFIEAYRGLHSLRRWESFVFWLYRIARNLCVDWIKAESRRPDSEFIEDQDPNVLESPSLDSYREGQLGESLKEALDALPETYREVLMLHYFGGMAIKEIARAVGASPAAIGKRLSRARSQLREEMIAMMDTAFEGQRLQASFTFRVVEAIKRIKIHPMPRMAGLPWGLSLAAGIIVTVLSLNPHVSITSDIAMPAGSPLSAQAKALEAGEIAVDILKASEISIIASKQGSDNGAKPQNTFSPAPQRDEGGKWTKKTGMSKGKFGLSTCAVDGIIYTIGGTGRSYDPVPDVEAYDPAADIWVKKADMPTARWGLSASAVDGIIYTIGGGSDQNTPLSTVEAYDPAADTWTSKADMPTARIGISTSVVDGIIYAIGGFKHQQEGAELSAVEAYNPVTDTWVTKVDMPTARGWLSTSVVNGIIYAIGGGGAGPHSNVEAYDPTMDTWIQKEDMPTARSGLSASVVDGIIYAIGGNIGGEAGFKIATVEAYNPAEDTWTPKADMPTARIALSTSVVNGYVYAIGGWSQVPNEPTNAVEEFDPGTPSGGKAVEPTGKLPTKWGHVKSD